MSNNSKFEREYFEGEDSHFSKSLGYDILVKLNLWRLKKYKNKIKTHSTFHKSLLDIGCGYGHFLDILKNDFTIHGMDISNHAIKVASKRVDCEYKQGNLEDVIPFNMNFDVITAISVVEHLIDPRKALENIHAQLNDGGLFCLEIPTVSGKISKIVYDLFFASDKTHIFIKSVDEIEALISSCGFKKLAVYSSLLPFFTQLRNWVENFSFVFGVFEKI
ncbi:MAG: class I SAM-dependent methyltransferase [Candidatus Lokiarchaeota archaeon]|nr:class I SAM-dependent methyltransferase [Candidatus Lokiarchaeota archaeon]